MVGIEPTAFRIQTHYTLISSEPRLGFEISQCSQRLDCIAQLAEHWASIPKVVGSILSWSGIFFNLSDVDIHSS